MEAIATNKQMSEVTIDILLDFIKNNFSTLQRNTTIIEETKEEPKKVTSKENKKEPQPFNFFKELNESSTSIRFTPNFIKSELFDNFLVQNCKNILTEDDTIEESDSSNSKKKKVDYHEYTFYISVLYLLGKSKYSDLVNFVKTIGKHISYGGFTEYNYNKLKWNKKSLKDNVLNNVIDAGTVRIICDYLHINIFIVNEDKKEIEYGGGDYVPFKKNLLIYKNKDNFYPIFTEKEKYFKFDNSVIKYYLTNPKEFQLLSITEFACKEEDLSKYINLSTILPDITVQHKAEETSVINKFDENYSETNKQETESESDDETAEEQVNNTQIDEELLNKYMKMSLLDIKKEAKKYNIPTQTKNNKPVSKKELCESIIKNKNKN
jgi:hypothetical protein